jgi:hypothetical protein
MRTLKVEPVGDLLVGDIHRIFEGLRIYFADDIEGRHKESFGLGWAKCKLFLNAEEWENEPVAETSRKMDLGLFQIKVPPGKEGRLT